MKKITRSLHWIMAALLALSYFSVPRFKLPHSKHGRASRTAIILYEKNGCHVSKLKTSWTTEEHPLNILNVGGV
jgi:hypothetical protein